MEELCCRARVHVGTRKEGFLFLSLIINGKYIFRVFHSCNFYFNSITVKEQHDATTKVT